MQILYYMLTCFRVFCAKNQARLHWEAGVAVVFETLCCYMGWEMQAAGRKEMPRMGSAAAGAFCSPSGGGPQCAAQRCCTKSLRVVEALP